MFGYLAIWHSVMWFFRELAVRMLTILCATIIVCTTVLAMAYNSPNRGAAGPYQGAGGTGPGPMSDTGHGDDTLNVDTGGGGGVNLVVWAVGDNCDDDFTSQQTTNVEGCKHVGDMIKADNTTNKVLLLGDTQYEEGEAANYTNYFDKGMGKQQIFAGASDSIWSRSIAAVGNHEYLTADAAPFFAYFGTARSGDPSEGYFMTDLGKWRVIVLNSNCSQVGGCAAGNPQGVWAINALDAATAAGDSTIVMYHHPPFTDGEGYAPGTTSGLPLWQIAYDHGADIVATGHDHQYQRFGPLSRTGTVQSGGPQFWVSGAGGKGNNGFSTLSGTDRTLFEWGKQPDGSQKEPGALRFVLKDDGTYTFQFKTSSAGVGTVRDSGSGTSR